MLDAEAISVRALKIEFREFCTGLTLKMIGNIFSAADFSVVDGTEVDGTRRGLVSTFYDSEDWSKPSAVQKLLTVIEYTLQSYYLDDQVKESLQDLCVHNGLVLEDNKVRRDAPFKDTNNFAYQFPAGLPFGVPKPSFSIRATQGGQKLGYELQDGLGLLKGTVYPNFTFQELEADYGLDSSTNKVLKNALVDMNQSLSEKSFFLAYAHKFYMADANVPVLIPQAWIQWHSQSKKNLRTSVATYSDELYRVDFVAFWNNERYAILIDDISHYAVKQKGEWFANQEIYSNRLKEDRKLKKENWQVFRVSNWELRSDEKTQEVLDDMREFIGF